jgi:hypothetical protein
MQWVVLFLISAAAATLACIVVGLLARLVSLIPWAGLRKWLVILCALSLLALVAWLAVLGFYFSEDFRDLWRMVVNDYRTLPYFTLLLTVPAVTAAAFGVGALVSGFRPEPFVPYEPRASYWSLRGMAAWLALMAGVLSLALVAQDFTLREDLREHAAEAADVARKLAPASVDAADNAAVHYQRVVDMMDEINKWREEGPDDLTEQLLKCEVEDEAVAEYFRRLEPMFAELRLAARCNHCRFDDKYVPLHIIDGMEARYALITAMQLVRQLSNYQACQARPAEAIESLELIRRFVDHLDDDPRAREGVFYYWCEGWVQQGVEHLSAHGGELPPEVLHRLVVTEPLPTETIYREGIQWHAAAIQQHVVNVYSGAEFQRPEFQFDQAFGQGRDKTAPHWLLLAAMRATTQSDELAALRATFPFVERPDDDDAWKRKWDEAIPSGRLVSSALSISYLPHWVDRAEADRRLTNIAVAAMLYRQDEGQWPESLEALVPKHLEAVLPPGEGEEPFRVKAIEGGLMVYSADLDDEFKKFEDKQAWWESAGDFVHSGYSLFLGRARERLIEFEPGW